MEAGDKQHLDTWEATEVHGLPEHGVGGGDEGLGGDNGRCCRDHKAGPEDLVGNACVVSIGKLVRVSRQEGPKTKVDEQQAGVHEA